MPPRTPAEPLEMQDLRAALPSDPFGSDAGEQVLDDDEAAFSGAGLGGDVDYDPWAQAARDAAARSDARPQPLCPAFLASGVCPRGERCDRAHGLLCARCGRHALHPTDERAAAAHEAECAARHERLAARSRTAALECGICLERVMGKPDPAARRFGLLNCEHCFCLPCIRAWRQEGEVDTETALRTCPVCRQTAHFVTPSNVWPETAEQREAIVAAYRAKLGTIDCMYFDKGRGVCPFGISCHYRHAYDDGSLEDRTCRIAAVDDGELRLVKPVQLSDYIQITKKKSKSRRS
ncbi:hypothetical protein QBZ16_000884 [Prototheca wickerhamii]|uniref:RING-type E3 ubiquitin transferase n=1 Tax=Prototheca wickerhamii TaxID=3111 RepID=A0AAD9IFV1_PROWI|nr:hypothetical protein QBZ16_000884 [Prototheca wickerhamii]